ncbi:MAG: hypothetical protein IPM39_07075 [Chloroflexi bacterium]|nr:hypothetical protein [Chloroflexota bacterium]
MGSMHFYRLLFRWLPVLLLWGLAACQFLPAAPPTSQQPNTNQPPPTPLFATPRPTAVPPSNATGTRPPHSPAAVPPPEIYLSGFAVENVGVQSPVYLGYQVIGRDLAEVALFGGAYEADGRRRLLLDIPLGRRDGLLDDLFIWDTRAAYLVDAAGSGDFALAWPMAADSDQLAAPGVYSPANGPSQPANLLFAAQANSPARLASQGDDPTQINPQPGDAFQLTRFYLDENGAIGQEPGPILAFDDAGLLAVEWRTLPDGPYFLGIRAENAIGTITRAVEDLTITNSQLLSGVAVYLNPRLGLQFLHPDDWHTPSDDDTLLRASDLNNQTQMQITLYPELERGMNSAALRNQTLGQFGPVDVLFSDGLTIAGVGGSRVAYGYTRPDGQERVGLFFAFVKDGRGYVVDVDGPQTAETQTITAAQTIGESWRFFHQADHKAYWTRADLGAFTVAYPPGFAYQSQDGWRRFVADGRTFVALRLAAETRPLDRALAALLRDAEAGVAGFQAGQPFALPLGGAEWQRVDMVYTAVDGTEIWGFIMVRQVDGQEITAWAEAPANVYPQLESSVFLTLIADMELK